MYLDDSHAVGIHSACPAATKPRCTCEHPPFVWLEFGSDVWR
jgi:hypothetical protein